MKDDYSSTSTVLSGVPQGSLLGAILFNIQVNDIFYSTDESGLYNFDDDNNLSAIGDTIEEAKSTLKQQTTNVLIKTIISLIQKSFISCFYCQIKLIKL